MIKQVLFYTVIVVAFLSCRKLQPPVNNEFVTIIQNTSVLSYSPRICTLKVKYYINSDYGLLDARYFHFNNFDTFNRGLNINETDRKIIYEPGGAYSALVLMNKSMNDSFAKDYLPVFESSILNFYSNVSGYEINFAACGNNNYCNGVKFISTEFEKNISQFSIQDIGYLFDYNTNFGSQNVTEALDTALNFIAKNARNANRLIYFITQDNDSLDPGAVTALINKAIALNTKICVFNLDYYGEGTDYNKQYLYNNTNGYYASGQSNSYYRDYNFSLIFQAIDKNMQTGLAYESTFVINSDQDFFDQYSAAQITLFPVFFDNSTCYNQILYERN